MLTSVVPALHGSGYKCLDRIRVGLGKGLGAKQIVLQHRHALIVHINGCNAVPVAVAAVIAVNNQPQLVVGHGRRQGYSIRIKLIHREVLGDIIRRKSVLGQQCLDFILIAQSPVSDLSSRSSFLNYLLRGCGRCSGRTCVCAAG